MVQLPDLDEQFLQGQAASAGFASVSLYVQSLIDRDADRLAVLEGLRDVAEGRHRPFDEFDCEFREKQGFAPRE